MLVQHILNYKNFVVFILELDFGAIKSCVFALLTVIPNHIIDELIKVQTNFICKNTPAKIKHKRYSTLLYHKNVW